MTSESSKDPPEGGGSKQDNNNNSSSNMDIDLILERLSLNDKLRLVTGASLWKLAHDFPSLQQQHGNGGNGNNRNGNLLLLEHPMTLSDGPHGVRKPITELNLHQSYAATCFPTAAALACSWDIPLLTKVGHTLAVEAAHYNVSILLGPGMNLKRHAAAGRNFEYLSEDPVLTGRLAAAYVQGLQTEFTTTSSSSSSSSTKKLAVGCSIKHYAINNQESHRFVTNAVVDERTARELYLAGFEHVVKQQTTAAPRLEDNKNNTNTNNKPPATVMAAYNAVNGAFCTEHDVLLKQILRQEWKYEGVVVTDWGATNNRVAALAASCDLEMPGSHGVHNADIVKALSSAAATTTPSAQSSRTTTTRAPTQSDHGSVQSGSGGSGNEQQQLLANKNGGAGISNNTDNHGQQDQNNGDIELSQPSLDETSSARREQQQLDIQHVDDSCRRILQLYQDYPPHAATDEQAAAQCPVDWQAHHEIARQTAMECAVLLRNENNLLPITKAANNNNKSAAAASVALIGDFAREHARFQGMGSSAVCSSQVSTVYDQLQKYTDTIYFAAGYHADDDHPENINQELVDEAVQQAQKAPVAILCIGLPEIMESEGFDREHLSLPAQHNALVDAVCRVNQNVVVVLTNGGVVELPWYDRVQAILEGYLPGQAGGAAVVDLIYGVQSPCGKLAETFPCSVQDIAADAFFPGSETTVEYREGLNVGYRYFDTANKPVRYPFGHGLSYTTFQYDNLQLNVKYNNDTAPANGDDDGEQSVIVDVHFTLTNTGSMTGKEVAQCYVHDVESSVYRPQQELRAFCKIELQPGQNTQVHLRLTDEAFAFYDVGFRKRVVENGAFEIRIGSSSRDIRLQGTVTLQNGLEQASAVAQMTYPPVKRGENVCPTDDASFDLRFAAAAPGFCRIPSAVDDDAAASAGEFHRNSLLKHIASKRCLGWILRKIVLFVAAKQIAQGHQRRRQQRMLQANIDNMPLRTMVLFSKGNFSFTLLDAFIALMNYHFLTCLGLVASAIAGLFRRRK